MASVCGRARQALQSCPSRNVVVSKLLGSKSSSNLPAFTASTKPKSFSISSPKRLFSSSRIPVELGCAHSLMPLHSATSSALFTSLLSLHAQSWGILSEVDGLNGEVVAATCSSMGVLQSHHNEDGAK